MASRVPMLARGLLERDAEREAFQRAVAAAVIGSGPTIALEGEAGVGKTSLLDHARGCARAAGMRVLSARGGELEPPPRRAARSGRDALTPSELRVAQLAADGRSNREIAQALFVTVRTVEGHLTQAYMKLDISSREQLAKELSTHHP